MTEKEIPLQWSHILSFWWCCFWRMVAGVVPLVLIVAFAVYKSTEPKADLFPLLLILSASFATLIWHIITLRMAMMKRYKTFRIAIIHKESQKESLATVPNILSFYWCFQWRTMAGSFAIGFVMGFIIGFIIGMSAENSSASQALAAQFNMIAGSLIGMVWMLIALRMAFEKKYKAFRVAIVEKMNEKPKPAPLPHPDLKGS